MRGPVAILPPRSAAIDAPARVFLVGIALLAALLGLLAGRQPAMAIAAALALVWVALTLSELSIGVALFTVVMFFPEAGMAKAAGLLLALSWLATVVARRARPSLVTRRPVLAGALTLFIAWAALGLLWAKRPDLADEAVTTLILSCTLFPIVF